MYTEAQPGLLVHTLSRCTVTLHCSAAAHDCLSLYFIAMLGAGAAPLCHTARRPAERAPPPSNALTTGSQVELCRGEAV